MADFSKGQTFLDKSATNYQGAKPKYFIALSDADDDDDFIICFVMNTEHRMDQYHWLCNKEKQRFVIEPKTFSFITDPTSIILEKEAYFKYSEMYKSNIKLLDKADDTLIRQIKNCIDWNRISVRAANIIKQCFK